MKLTGVPEQIPVDDPVITTLGVNNVETAIVIVLEFTIAGDTQAAFDIIITAILSPFERLEEVNEGALIPMLTPLTCH